MAYIGNIPAESYASFERQVFTIVNSQTAYTLSHSVVNENDIRLVINSVVQEPGSGKAYTASSTTLTLSAALVNGTDEMYCVFLGRALQTVNPPNASVGSAQIADSLISGKTALGATPADTDELLISDAGTLKRVDYSYLKSANTPAFFAHAASDQNLTDNTYSKLTLGTEVFDTNGAFASSRFTVPSGQAGKYFFYGSVRTTTSSDTQLQDSYAAFYLNGSRYLENRMNFNNNYITVSTSLIHVVLDLDVADYVELYGAVNTTSSQARIMANEKSTNFGGYKILE